LKNHRCEHQRRDDIRNSNHAADGNRGAMLQGIRALQRTMSEPVELAKKAMR
jgi:hypothetical protein